MLSKAFNPSDELATRESGDPAPFQIPNSFVALNSTAAATATPYAHLPPGIPIVNGYSLDPPSKDPGTDPTAGYLLNHLMIRIHDPAASLHFYVDLMGMRTVFAMNAGPFTIYYLGFPQSDEHYKSTRQFAADTAQSLKKSSGLLELMWVHGSEKYSLLPPPPSPSPNINASAEEDWKKRNAHFHLTTGNHAPHLGFGHLGFTVPDVPAAIERFRRAGVPILKEVGVATVGSTYMTSWETQVLRIGSGELSEAYQKIFERIAVIQDPVSLSPFFSPSFRLLS